MRMVGVCKSFGDLKVLDAFDAQFPDRGLVGVAGPSGSGKTTLLRIIAGLEQPDAGRIEDAPERVSVQFEDDRLFPWLDALSNVTLIGCSDAQARALFDELGLSGKEHARIAQLSGGQRRRVALARALAFPAPVCLLDEPTARLDEASSDIVMDAIERRSAESLVIMSSHDTRALRRCSQSLCP